MEAMIYLVSIGIMGAICGYMLYQRNLWKDRAERLREFVENPHTSVRDPKEKEAEYKDSFEAKLNALEDERREQHDALMAAFDLLNELSSITAADNIPYTQIQQTRNVLLMAIQNSTYRP